MTNTTIKKKAGRPKGSRNKITTLREAEQREILKRAGFRVLCEIEAVIDAMVEKAKGGDVQAAKLILDRCIPARKAVEHINANTDVTIVIKPAGDRDAITATAQQRPATGSLPAIDSPCLEN